MTPQRTLMTCAALTAATFLGGCGESQESEPSLTASTTIAEPTTNTATTTTVPAGPAASPVELVGNVAPADGFNQPSFVALDNARDRVYVVDSENRRLVSFARDGTNPTVIQTNVALNFHQEGSLGAVDVDTDGSLYVAESGTGRIVHMTPEGGVLSRFTAEPPFGRLFSLSLDRVNGLVYAVDDEDDVIVVFDRDGHELRRLLSHGVQPGQIANSGALELLADGSFWIADAGNRRVQHLAADGSVLQVIGPFAKGDTGFLDSPNDVAVDAAGRIWVVDYSGSAVVVFDPDGTPVASVGGTGDANRLPRPVSLAFDDARHLYVTERDSDQLIMFNVASN